MDRLSQLAARVAAAGLDEAEARSNESDLAASIVAKLADRRKLAKNATMSRVRKAVMRRVAKSSGRKLLLPPRRSCLV